MQRPLLIATTNPHKIEEIVELLRGVPLTLTTLTTLKMQATPDGGAALDVPEETGSTFEENARQKALYYAGATGLPTVAEDSGFEVDALDRQPGIHSARYLHPDATYPKRFDAIYSELRQRPGAGRAARYVCAVVVAEGAKVIFETRGVVEGELAPMPAGSAGFGYDPIFYYPPHGRTFGQLSPQEKAAVSHRGIAIRELRGWLERNYI